MCSLAYGSAELKILTVATCETEENLLFAHREKAVALHSGLGV
jgi:hypothetical protein